jgi:hypothetical protein
VIQIYFLKLRMLELGIGVKGLFTCTINSKVRNEYGAVLFVSSLADP